MSNLGIILVIILIIVLFGGAFSNIRGGPYLGLGYGTGGGVLGVILVIVLVLILFGHI